MSLRKAAAKIDKVVAKERELVHSRSYPQLRLQVVVDRHFVTKKENNAVQIVESREFWDVTLVHKGIVVQYPSDVLPWLGHFDQYWGAAGFGGLLRLHVLYCMLGLLDQHGVVDSTTETKQGSSRIRQAVSRQPSGTHK